MSQHVYVREMVGGGWDICGEHEAKDVEAALPGKVFTLSCDGPTATFDFADELTAGEVTTLDGIIAASKASGSHLTRTKASKVSDIDLRTRELIAQGFSFAGKQFSLSSEAQARLMGINQVRNEAEVTYPIRWNTLDDLDVYDIPDAATVLSFYLTAMATYRAHVDGGTTLKDQVRAAVDVAGVAAVVDNR